MIMDIPLEEVARHVNWYTDPTRLLANANLFLCQVMARGTIEDVVTTQHRYSWEEFKKAYLSAPPGLFSKRAWAYWGLMLVNDPKYPMPERFPGSNQFDWRRGP
jgi:hypothetical protein